MTRRAYRARTYIAACGRCDRWYSVPTRAAQAEAKQRGICMDCMRDRIARIEVYRRLLAVSLAIQLGLEFYTLPHRYWDNIGYGLLVGSYVFLLVLSQLISMPFTGRGRSTLPNPQDLGPRAHVQN